MVSSVITIPVPEREDYFESELGIKPGKDSRLNIIMRQSNYDMNQFPHSMMAITREAST